MFYLLSLCCAVEGYLVKNGFSVCYSPLVPANVSPIRDFLWAASTKTGASDMWMSSFLGDTDDLE